MTEMLRKEVAAAARTIVVKVGTRVVTGDSGYLDDGRIARLAEQLRAVVPSRSSALLHEVIDSDWIEATCDMWISFSA